MMRRVRLNSLSNSKFKVMMAAHLTWMIMVCLLGAWWGRLLLTQAGKIAEMEGRLGLAVDLTQSHWHRTQRMLYWESLTFFGLLLVCTAFLFWLYWRDHKRVRGLQAFFASVTHELRTPLSSIRLQAESIAEGLSGDHSHQNVIQRLLEDTIRLEGQVERTLELARVEGGGPVYNQPLQIKPWLDRFLKSWSADYQDRVEFNVEVEDVLIEADPAAMRIIFKNLLENSIRHSNLNKQDKVRISISMETHEKGISFLMKDNGQGYRGDERNLGKLFHKDPLSPGTGVGLYLVKTLMKRMGGWADFRVRSGFEVSLGFLEGKLNG